MKEPIWIEEAEALRLHDKLLAMFGGPPGLRDASLLKSALARAPQKYAYVKNPRIADLAAAYTFGIVRNHPFVDGNKRTGFLLGVLFLELNGYRFNADEASAAKAVIALADGSLDEDEYAAFLRANVTHTRKKK